MEMIKPVNVKPSLMSPDPLPIAASPNSRPRRLRLTPVLRSMVRETELNPRDFISPLFVRPGRNVKAEIRSMPGVYQWSIDRLPVEIEEIARLGIPAVILF
ncbi:MAG TPA: hypothetical protein VI755_04430, partial [Anaerolineales bacterium]|nr:hypothetical protein [Anaerolineales bacterium]